jgi:hypothetical protein
VRSAPMRTPAKQCSWINGVGGCSQPQRSEMGPQGSYTLRPYFVRMNLATASPVERVRNAGQKSTRGRGSTVRQAGEGAIAQTTSACIAACHSLHRALPRAMKSAASRKVASFSGHKKVRAPDCSRPLRGEFDDY